MQKRTGQHAGINSHNQQAFAGAIRRNKRPLSMLASLSLLGCHLALAEEDNTSEQESYELPMLTVTSRYETESAHDLPFGISILNADDLEQRGIFTLEAALRDIPGVDVNSSGAPTILNTRIRGVGSLYIANRDDTSVGLAIDGVPTSTENFSLGTLDVERFEVLKGPQSSIFGRNSEAGAINITTNKPTPYFEAGLRARYGEDQQHLLEGVVSGPISDQFSARLAVRRSGSEHWIDNLQNGEPVTEPKQLALRGSLLWQAEDTSASLVLEQQQRDDDVAIQLLSPYGKQPVYDITPGTFNDNSKDLQRYSLQLEHEFEHSTLTSVTAFTQYDLDHRAATDRVLTNVFFGFPGEVLNDSKVDETVLSQDIRWASLPSDRVFWLLGLNFWDSDRDSDTLDRFNGASYQRQFTTKSYSAYGEITYPISDLVNITTGLRHTWDKKTYNARYLAKGVAVDDTRNVTDNYTTGRIGLSYALNDTTNLYVTGSRGYKSGGINEFSTNVADSKPFNAAKVNTVEVGFKILSNDEHFYLNGAIFYNKVKDDHLLGFDATTFASNILNADTQSKGAELEAQWRFDNGFTLTGGITYLDAEITSNVTGVYGGPVSAGNQSPDVPTWSSHLNIDYQRQIGSILGMSAPVLNANLNYRHVGKRAADVQNNFDLDSYAKVDMKVGLSGDNLDVYLWGNNLLDEEYELYGFGFGGGIETGAPARGRAVGLGIGYQY